MIDLYCERLGPGLWVEPANALTNLAFLAAAWASWRIARCSEARPGGITLLLGLMVTIGIGSGLFHTFATTWAQLLDVIPILLFTMWYTWLYARRVISVGRDHSGVLVGGFFVAAMVSRRFHAVLNGSLMYAPAFLILLGLGVFHFKKSKQERGALLAASGVFILALFFRTIDQAVCPRFPLGTHFLWHVLDAAVLYLASRALILNWSKAGGRTL